MLFFASALLGAPAAKLSALSPGTDPTTCKAIDSNVADSWCSSSCSAEPPYCPVQSCTCDGPNPSPSPVAVPLVKMPDIPEPPKVEAPSPRPATEQEIAAQKAAQEREAAFAGADKAREAADKAREAADKARIEEDAKRVADAQAARQAIASPTAGAPVANGHIIAATPIPVSAVPTAVPVAATDAAVAAMPTDTLLLPPRSR